MLSTMHYNNINCSFKRNNSHGCIQKLSHTCCNAIIAKKTHSRPQTFNARLCAYLVNCLGGQLQIGQQLMNFDFYVLIKVFLKELIAIYVTVQNSLLPAKLNKSAGMDVKSLPLM